MKKKIALLLVLAAALSLCACGHQHSWADATCTEPKTCTECGESEGEPLGHDAFWNVTRVSSLLEEGEEGLICFRCGEVLETRSLEKKSTAFENGSFSFSADDFVVYFTTEFGSRLTAEKCGDELVERGTDAHRLTLGGSELGYLSFEETESGLVRTILFQSDSFDGINLSITAFNLLSGNELLKTRDIFFALTDFREYSEGGLKMTMDVTDATVILSITGES